MKNYTEIQTFKLDKEMKNFLNVSKFIRDSINKNRPEIKINFIILNIYFKFAYLLFGQVR